VLISFGKDIEESDKCDKAANHRSALLMQASSKFLPNGWQATANSQPTLKINLQAGYHSRHSPLGAPYYLPPQIFESFFKTFNILLVRPYSSQYGFVSGGSRDVSLQMFWP
jgi:hypothetical protein